MLQAMFAGVSGLQAHQVRMNVIGNNIANVNTIGFRAGRVSFQDQLSQTIRAATGPGRAGQGGGNPAQLGLGVTVGSIDALQTQGNLQTTGKPTDLAIQGGGFFIVNDGSGTAFSRDGSFDLDSAGTLVNPATGYTLLGYLADATGAIDTSVPVTKESVLRIPLGLVTDAKQTQNITFQGNLDAASALYSTKLDLSGNLDLNATSGTFTSTSNVFDQQGNAHTIQINYTNPSNVVGPTPPAPAGATRSWDINVLVDGASVFNSTAGRSKIYQVGSNLVFANPTTGGGATSQIQLNGGTGFNQASLVPGAGGAPAFPIDLNFNQMTSVAGSNPPLSGLTDGQSGSNPVWGTSIRVFDRQGTPHLVTFRYQRQQIGSLAPAGSTSQWDWTATMNGAVIASNTTSGNSSVYFGPEGRIISGSSQKIQVTPPSGQVPAFNIDIDMSLVSQLASQSTAAAGNQDGYPTGTLQTFTIGSDGLIKGIFSSGQTRDLGRIATASFTNPGGLERIGSNLMRESINSGAAQVGLPGANNRGKITTGYLESSNVDLSNEFTNMIITQRGFQANTRIISVVDDLLQELINLKR